MGEEETEKPNERKLTRIVVFAPLYTLVVGSRYISMSAYQASRDDEISFVKGAIVRLIKKYADGWWLVRYVPVCVIVIKGGGIRGKRIRSSLYSCTQRPL